MLVPDRHTVVRLQAYSQMFTSIQPDVYKHTARCLQACGRMFTSMRSDVYKHTVDFLTAYYYE